MSCAAANSLISGVKTLILIFLLNAVTKFFYSGSTTNSAAGRFYFRTDTYFYLNVKQIFDTA